MRNIAIDRLRTAMMCVVMFGHAMLPYVTISRRFNDPSAHIGFDSAGVLLYAFAMPAFFVTAGFSAAALFERRGAAAFWQNRAVRIGVPLIVGYLVLTPLTRAAYQFAAATANSGSLAIGWQAVTALDWLRYGKLYHLWFLASLIVFSLLTYLVVLVIHNSLSRVIGFIKRRTTGQVFSALVLTNCGLMTFSYADGTGQGTDLPVQLSLLLYFVAGWWLFSHTDLLGRVSGITRTLRGGFLLLVPLCIWASRQRLLEEHKTDWVMGTLAGTSNALIGALSTIWLLALFQQRFTRESAVADYLASASYWIYLVHYPVIVFAGGAVSVLQMPAVAKYGLTLLIAVPLIFGGFEILRRARRS